MTTLPLEPPQYTHLLLLGWASCSPHIVVTCTCVHLLPIYQLSEGRMPSWDVFVSCSGLAQLLAFEQDGWIDGWMEYIRIHFIPGMVCIQGLIHSFFQQTHTECPLCAQCWDWPQWFTHTAPALLAFLSSGRDRQISRINKQLPIIGDFFLCQGAYGGLC